MNRIFEEIDGSRRRILSMAASSLAAPKLGFARSALGQSEVPGLREVKPEAFFPGFSAEMVETTGTKIHVLRKGSGRPLLLLHGYPETHLTWHKVAPKLAEQFSVVVPDLRGYGNSGKPQDGERHENYSFREMAQDQVDLMQHYGHDRFLVAAHDRGARVAHRLCLDHPESVEKVCLMDIAPTLTMYPGTNREFATRYMWWFFLIQAYPLPEHMIGLDPKFYLQYIFESLNKTPGAIGPDEMNEYIHAFSNDSTIHATCEDFRAGEDIDLEMDQADDEAGRKIQCPVHGLWGAKGTVGVMWDVLATWREKSAAPVTGKALDCGHFLPEERPQEVIDELLRFFSLSAAGRQRVAGIHGFARAQVATALGQLEPEQCQTVLHGLQLYDAAPATSGDEKALASPLNIVAGYRPGLVARITEMHALYYSRTSGFGQHFESVVAGGLSEFCDRLEKPCNEIWLAVQDGRIVGSLAIDGEDLGAGIAHLRWFIVDDGVRGSGAGRRLLDAAMAFVDEKDFAETHLWTFVGLSAAHHLYESYGFECVEERPGCQWGREVMEQRFVRCHR